MLVFRLCARHSAFQESWVWCVWVVPLVLSEDKPIITRLPQSPFPLPHISMIIYLVIFNFQMRNYITLNCSYFNNIETSFMHLLFINRLNHLFWTKKIWITQCLKQHQRYSYQVLQKEQIYALWIQRHKHDWKHC